MKRKLFAVLISLFLLIGMAPATINAESEIVDSGTWGGIDWTLTNDGTLTIARTKSTGTLETNPRTGKPYNPGVWREPVVYKNGKASAIGGWPYDYNKVTRLIIEEGVESIPSFAVWYHKNLRGDLVIPSTVTTIGQEAFSGMTGTGAQFSSISFAEGSQIKCITHGVFKYQYLITSIDLPEGLECLHAWVFSDCKNLKSVTLPNTIGRMQGSNHREYEDGEANKSWGDSCGVFSNCTKIETITFGGEEVKTLFYAKTDNTIGKDSVAAAGLTYCRTLESALAQGTSDVKLLKNCTVKGSGVIVPEGVTLEIPEGLTLTVPAGSSLVINGTLVGGERISGGCNVVTYVAEGEIVSTQYVPAGDNAVAPAVPEKIGHTGVWEADGTNITEATTIEAVYTINTYPVTHVADGTVVNEQTVEHGGNAVAPAVPEKIGHTGVWEADGTNITEATTIEAVYTINTYPVTYVADGVIVSEQEIAHGSDADVPAEIPAKLGYDQTPPYWDHDGKNITAATTVSAVYTVNTYSVTYVADGVIVSEQEITHGSAAEVPAVPEKIGHTGVWEADGTNITEATTIEAVYTINTYPVTYVADGVIVSEQEITHGSNAEAPKVPFKIGYDGAWDHNGEDIIAATTIAAIYTPWVSEEPSSSEENVPNESETVIPGQQSAPGTSDITNPPVSSAPTVSGAFKDVTRDTNALNLRLEETNNELRNAVSLSVDEQTANENGADVEFWISAMEITGTVPVSEQQLIDQAFSGETVPVYLEICMYKRVGDSAPVKMAQLQQNVTVTLDLPEQLINTNDNVKREYYIIHAHSGRAEIIIPLYDERTQTLTFKTSSFSTYAIGYSDTPLDVQVPDTGNTWQGASLSMVFITVLAGLAMILTIKKKKLD